MSAERRQSRCLSFPPRMIQAARSLANLVSTSRTHHLQVIATTLQRCRLQFLTSQRGRERDYFDSRPEAEEESCSATVASSSNTKRPRLRQYSLRFDLKARPVR